MTDEEMTEVALILVELDAALDRLDKGIAVEREEWKQLLKRIEGAPTPRTLH